MGSNLSDYMLELASGNTQIKYALSHNFDIDQCRDPISESLILTPDILAYLQNNDEGNVPGKRKTV